MLFRSWSDSSLSGANVTDMHVGTYSLTVSDARGCEAHEVITIESPDAIVLTANVANVTCHGLKDGIVEISAEGGSQPYFYSLTSGDNTISGMSIYTGLASGMYEISATDANGCVESRGIYLLEPEKLTMSFETVNPSCKGNNDGQIHLAAMGGTAPYMYGWFERYSDQPVIGALYQGQYTVSVVDANKCSSSADIYLEDNYVDCLKIPNVFTPNGDGVNDTWIIGNIEMFPDAHIYVFNRWGQLLYKANGSDDSWDGKIRGGQMAPAGVYMYIIELHTNKEAYKGTVTIVY